MLEPLSKKVANPTNINKIEELLDAVTNNMATNMSQKQMLSFYEVIKNMITKSFNDGDFITIQKTQALNSMEDPPTKAPAAITTLSS